MVKIGDNTVYSNMEGVFLDLSLRTLNYDDIFYVNWHISREISAINFSIEENVIILLTKDIDWTNRIKNLDQ